MKIERDVWLPGLASVIKIGEHFLLAIKIADEIKSH